MSDDYKPCHAAPKPRRRRMAANPHAVFERHNLEHDESPWCASDIPCQPVVPEPPESTTSPRAEDGHKHGTAPIDATTHEREAMRAAYNSCPEGGDVIEIVWNAARRYVPPTSEPECAWSGDPRVHRCRHQSRR